MCKAYKAYLYYQHHCGQIRNVYNAHKPYIERDIHQSEFFFFFFFFFIFQYVRQMGPTTQNHTNETLHISCRMPWLRNDDSLYWSPLLIPYGRRVFGSSSSLLLSWFDLSTPGYGLSNKAWRGWGNHVLVNRSVLRQDTSRTACVSNNLGGRSSVGSHNHRFHQHIVFHTWCML